MPKCNLLGSLQRIYMYIYSVYFSLDATNKQGRLGRLVNHSKTKANVVTKVLEVVGQPRLCLIASKDIEKGSNLQYDYGDRRKVAIKQFPWLVK